MKLLMELSPASRCFLCRGSVYLPRRTVLNVCSHYKPRTNFVSEITVVL